MAKDNELKRTGEPEVVEIHLPPNVYQAGEASLDFAGDLARRGNTAMVHNILVLADQLRGKIPNEFVPNTFQRVILQALKGRALKVEALANEVAGGDKSRLYKKDGIKELKEKGLVDHRTRLGYFSTEFPPT